MNEQELLLKNSDELVQIAAELTRKIDVIMQTDKESPKRCEYFDELETILAILKRRGVF